LVFSGGRGYHIHIRTPKVLDMDGDERREIMDYVAGSFQDFRDIFPKKRVPRVRSVYMAYMLPSVEGGWGGMVRETAIELVKSMEKMGKESAIELIKECGIRRNTAERIYESLFGKRGGWKGILKGDMEVFRTETERDNFIKLIEHQVRKKYGVHPDIHVTQDTKRLIRLPLSLHGGTGFMVKPLKRDELDDFIPTRDAVPDIYGDEKVDISVEGRENVGIRGESYIIKRRDKVPEYVAVYLLLSGKGKMV
jgi:DNA primase small subunit